MNSSCKDPREKSSSYLDSLRQRGRFRNHIESSHYRHGSSDQKEQLEKGFSGRGRFIAFDTENAINGGIGQKERRIPSEKVFRGRGSLNFSVENSHSLHGSLGQKLINSSENLFRGFRGRGSLNSSVENSHSLHGSVGQKLINSSEKSFRGFRGRGSLNSSVENSHSLHGSVGQKLINSSEKSFRGFRGRGSFSSSVENAHFLHGVQKQNIIKPSEKSHSSSGSLCQISNQIKNAPTLSTSTASTNSERISRGNPKKSPSIRGDWNERNPLKPLPFHSPLAPIPSDNDNPNVDEEGDEIFTLPKKTKKPVWYPPPDYFTRPPDVYAPWKLEPPKLTVEPGEGIVASSKRGRAALLRYSSRGGVIRSTMPKRFYYPSKDICEI